MELSATFSVIGILMTVMVHTTISMTTGATESIGETVGCPENSIWTPQFESCYLHLKDKLNFTQAKESCKELEAHLVFIDSEKENKYIQSFTGNGPLWIGLYRPTNKICAGSSCGNWMWLDESVPQYSQWAEGVGNNSNQCAFMDSAGDWDHGRSCSAARTYVCEQKLILPTTTQEPSTIRSTREIIFTTSYDAEGNFVFTTDVNGGNNGDGNIPIIVGCVVGGLVLVGIIIAVVVFAKRHRNTSKPDQSTREKDSKSPKRDKPSKKKDRIPSQRDKPKKHKDRKSKPKNQSQNYAIDDERSDGANGAINRGYSYEDAELVRKNKALKQVPANSATGAHGGGCNPEQIYAEPLKKEHRPVSDGVEVQENPLYGSGK